jgi:hypothetical protein
MIIQALAHVTAHNKKIFLLVYLFFAINACSTNTRCADPRGYSSHGCNQAIARLNALNNQMPAEKTPYAALGYAFGYAGKNIWQVTKTTASFAAAAFSAPQKPQEIDDGWNFLEYKEDRGATVIQTRSEKKSVRKPAPK